MAGEVVVDALPYIDQGYDDPGVRDAVFAMVEEETRRYRPTKNYLEHLPPLSLHAFETEVIRTEFERLQSRLPMEVLSMKRYELPQPAAGKMTDLAAWTECVDNSMAQLEHQATRICNLELMSIYGGEMWKSCNAVLSQMVNQSQKQLQDLSYIGQSLIYSILKDWINLKSSGKSFPFSHCAPCLEVAYPPPRHINDLMDADKNPVFCFRSLMLVVFLCPVTSEYALEKIMCFQEVH